MEEDTNLRRHELHALEMWDTRRRDVLGPSRESSAGRTRDLDRSSGVGFVTIVVADEEKGRQQVAGRSRGGCKKVADARSEISDCGLELPVPRGRGRGTRGAQDLRNGYHGQLRPMVGKRGSHGDADGGRTLPEIRVPEAP